VSIPHIDQNGAFERACPNQTIDKTYQKQLK
jgi:hypothetical protein